jgi:hypothetical protein
MTPAQVYMGEVYMLAIAFGGVIGALAGALAYLVR